MFPDAVRRYAVEGAAALGVPVDMVAVPLLAFAAGAVGNTRALRVKAGWVVRAILWLAVVGEPSSGKSPALDHARRPLDALQDAAWEAFRLALARWEADAAAAKGAKPPSPPRRGRSWPTSSPPTRRWRRWRRCWEPRRA